MIKKYLYIAWLLVFFTTNYVSAQMVITYRAQESKSDMRYEYDTLLLKLALDKTKHNYGDYKFVPSPVMNYSRAKIKLMKNEYPNFFVKLSYEDKFKEKMNLNFVKFPVDLGIVGYRVFFVSEQIKKKVSEAVTLDDLKKFTIGQGSGWSDISILRSAGFNVIEVPLYESLFSMVAANRFDLLSRGTNELLGEYESHKHMKNFTYDTSICLSYPLPRFFYTHASNTKAIQRVMEGLQIAYEDGSLQKLWMEQYRDSITFVNLNIRKIIKIENPNILNLDFNYQQYFYKPENEK